MTGIIDVPIESLPFIDEHVTDVRATDREVWDALLATLSRGGESGFARHFVSVIGAEHPATTGTFGQIGSTVPGFVVSRAVAPAVLGLLGEHRFARYALVFRIEKTVGGSRLSAESRAEFPGVAGRAYHAMVIGTRGHVLAVRRMLGAVRRRAER